LLPKNISHTKVPPIKCQGIKTKLVGFISNSIIWDGKGKWIEPFLGSGVVLFNIMPERALVSDINPHIINFYKSIQKGEITPRIAREYLEEEGAKLLEKGEEHYYEIRERFNEKGSPLDFLFVNRSCFNGLMRFNKKGGFNVPFCRKTDRFRPAYITKIVNQIDWISNVMKDKDWKFVTSDWQDTLSKAGPNDFVYLDPPYVGRHTDYFTNWDEIEAEKLAKVTRSLPCGFALSMWKENKYRTNDHLEKCWSGLEERNYSHFYHIGSRESLRNKMQEALIIQNGFASDFKERQIPKQLALNI
jgi:DNA adenine methylase